MQGHWFSTQVSSTVAAAFLASLVEFVEALTIVLAVGTTRGWKPALSGAFVGTALLSALVLTFGPALQLIPLNHLQLVIGILLLIFGFGWLKKAILRSAGVIAFRDEGKIYKKEIQILSGPHAAARGIVGDPVAFLASFKAVVLEGLEVVFIVLATGGAAHHLRAAAIGAAAAGVLVLGVGVIVHRPLTRVPENALKFWVGILLCSFGAFWTAEGLGFSWPGDDLFLLVLAGILATASFVAIRVIRKRT